MDRDLIQTVLNGRVGRDLPINGGGIDWSVYQVVPGYLAPVKSNTEGNTFFFRGKNQMIVSAQQDGDMAGVRCDGGSPIRSPLGRSKEREPRTIVEIVFDG